MTAYDPHRTDPEVAELVPLAEVPNHRPYLTVRHLRRLCQRHEIPFYRVGRRVCFRLADIDDWVRSRKVPASDLGKQSLIDRHQGDPE
jgi:excisionase family DNA binding protein